MIPCSSCTGILVPFVQMSIVWVFLGEETERTEEVESFWVVDVAIERVSEEEEEDDERYSGSPELEESR